MSQNNNPQYETTEIYTFANKSVLIGFNSLMKNVEICKTTDERKAMSKKNKIQISYVDLLGKTPEGKKPKHDFFVDIEEMKYLVDMVYEALLNPGSKNQIRQQGLKIMGGHKQPQVISNIITFNFLTADEFNQSQPNQKVIERFNTDKSKYSNAMMDWKNLQVARLQFDKKIGKIMNGLIVPTGQKVENTNFKPYFISNKELLEFCVTMKDFIQRTEMMFAFEKKMNDMQSTLVSEMQKTLSQALKQMNQPQTPNTQQNAPTPSQMASNTQQQVNVPNNTSTTPTVNKEEALKNELNQMMDKARALFIPSAPEKMGMFLDCLKVESVNFQNNHMDVKLLFSSELYKPSDLALEKEFFNNFYQRCVNKVLTDNEKKYTMNVSTLS